MNAAIKITIAVLTSFVALAASAQQSSPIAAQQGLTRAEVKADLALWQRAGLSKLYRGNNSPDTSSLAYRQAYAKYSQWRSGEEYARELARQQQK